MAVLSQDWARWAGHTADALERAGIVLTPSEREEIEVADFGLGRFEGEGLGILVYVNTDRCCAKELVMLPGQTCPQHRHPPVDGEPGKEETFRVRKGVCYLHVDAGPATANPKATAPGTSYHQLREVVLNPGQQYTIQPDTWHWFQAGPDGCIVSEFSTRSRDEADIFLDPNIQRVPDTEENSRQRHKDTKAGYG